MRTSLHASLHKGLPWCCAHKWTIGYIALVVSLELVLMFLMIYGVL